MWMENMDMEVELVVILDDESVHHASFAGNRLVQICKIRNRSTALYCTPVSYDY